MTARRDYPRWVEWLFGPTFRLIGFFYRQYTLNRDRVAAFMARPTVASLFRKAVVVTFLAWILVWLTASEESRERLTEAVRGGFQQLGTDAGGDGSTQQ